jgi:hypothetical protein
MPAIDLAFGSHIGRYQIVRRLGAGGMAEVFLARDPRLNRDVAVKVLGDKLVERPGYRVFLQREARAIARLNHPHIAQVYDVVDIQDRTCFVMEYIEGETLLERLRRGALPLEEVCRLGVQIAAAVGHAHAHGVLHCDLKPANIFVTTDGTVKVVDFGLARPIPAVVDSAAGIGASPTLVENRAGTPDYMAPEQYFGRPLDERGDLYSLGVVLHELATATRPAPWAGAREASSPSEPTRTLLADSTVPPPLRPILERTIAINPSDRFSSALELQAALERIGQPFDPRADAIQSPAHAAPTARRPVTATALRTAAWIAAIAAGVTGLGLLNSAVFNTVLERGEFAGEGVTDWFRWGVKSLVAPGVLATALLIVLALASSVVRWICRAWMPGLTTRASQAVRRTGLAHPTVLAQAVAAAGLAALALVAWRFSPLIAGLGASDGISTGDPQLFRIWSPGEFLEHRYFRMSLTIVVVLMTVSLYHIVKLRRRYGSIGERSSLATAFAVLGLAVLMLEHPYRLLQQDNLFETARVDSHTCYILGRTGTESLIFCPDAPVPRNRRFPIGDPRVQPLGCHGSVFDAVPRCGPRD